MSAGEVVGLVVTVAFFSAAAALSLVAITSGRLSRDARSKAARRDAFAAWLASWRTVSRASASFVAAFRALGAERPDSPLHTLRQEEAQRARADWCAAMRDLDRTEAALIVWCDDADTRAALARFQRVTPRTLQAAINSDSREVERLILDLHTQTDLVQAFVVERTSGVKSGRHALFAPFARLLTTARKIVQHWSRR